MRYIIKLSYSGKAFCGWQRQPNAPSVQEEIETALSTLLGGEVGVVGAGRTDTGVSAVGYIAHFEAPSGLDARSMCYKLNAILPKDIVVQTIAPADEDFHARFGAVRREYTYFLHRSKDPFAEGWSYLYAYPNLDFEAMNKAAELLLGTHDFSCFEKTGSDNKTSVCTVFEAKWVAYKPTHVEVMGFEGGEYYYFRIAANRFLRNMVRAVVGTLLEVGRGKRSIESVAALLDGGGNRSAAGESVPGHALFLSKIEY